jgi:hypothetical protein
MVDQRKAAREAGERNVVPGQAVLAALLRGLGREWNENSMGRPAGQALREELGSVGYDQVLRELFPDEFASGRLQGSENFPTDVMALSVPGMGPRVLGAARPMPVNPRLPGPAPLEGELMPPRPQLEGPLWDLSRPAPANTGPVSGFERDAVAAMQRARPLGARGPFRPEDYGNYWTEGGYFAPAEGDFVEVAARRNPEGYYSPSLMAEMSGRMQAGERNAFRHPLYGPVGDRPNYGEAPLGPSPWERMPRPGMKKSPAESPAPMGGRALTVPGGREVAPTGGRAMVPAQGGGGAMVPPNAGPLSPYGGGGLPAPYAPSGGVDYRALAAMGLAGALPALSGHNMPAQPAGGGALPFFASDDYPRVESTGFADPRIPPEIVKLAHELGAKRGLPLKEAKAGEKAPSKGAAKAAPKAQPSLPAQEWSPNFNYQVTKLLDNLFGTNEAERGREYQQYYEGL